MALSATEQTTPTHHRVWPSCWKVWQRTQRECNPQTSRCGYLTQRYGLCTPYLYRPHL